MVVLLWECWNSRRVALLEHQVRWAVDSSKCLRVIYFRGMSSEHEGTSQGDTSEDGGLSDGNRSEGGRSPVCRSKGGTSASDRSESGK